MITDYDVFCLRKNVLATLCRKLYEVLFQDNIANNKTGVAKLRLTSRMLLFEHLHAALLRFTKNYKFVFYFLFLLQGVEIL